jgi:hypothetical protein
MDTDRQDVRVRHTVFFQFKDDASQADIDNFFQEMAKLRTEAKVEGLLSLSYGAHKSDEGLNQGFTHGMTLVFENASARDTYLPHPEHDRVKEIVIPLLKDGLNSVIAIDWYLQGNNEV